MRSATDKPYSPSGDVPGDRRAWLTRCRRVAIAERTVWVARETRWSWGRLAVFAAAVLPWLLFPQRPLAAGGLTAVIVVLFVLTVRRHLAILAEREQADRLLRMADEARQRAGGVVVCIRDGRRPGAAPDEDALLPSLFAPGPTWPLTDQERDDLDLFAAPVGIFGLLNRTSTAPGARRLRDMLETPLLAAERIRTRQAAVRWLAEDAPERLDLMAGIAALRGEDQRLTRLIQALASARPLQLPIPVWLVAAWAALSAAFTVFVAIRTFGGDFALDWWLLPLLIVNGAFYGQIRARLAAALEPWRDVAWAVRGYRTAAGRAVAALRAAPAKPADGEQSVLGALHERCAAVSAPGALPSLYRRIGWSEGGGLARALVNVLAFADVFVARRLLACVLPQRAQLLAGVSAIAELDALCALGAFAWEQPVICYPTPLDRTGLWLAEGVHPLVPPERVVPNDVVLDAAARMWIITGSNMAGKSTLLRMVGTSVLLGQAAGIALAREMSWSPVRLITDLRARDNLAQSESYFLAEVRHLRRMILPPAGAAPVLGLIDEPFRGTNSDDQSAASLAVTQELLASPHLFLVATHDRRLTMLADGAEGGREGTPADGGARRDSRTSTSSVARGNGAKNFHFRENLAGDELVFDYRLHAGPAQTRNALRILSREGYPEELVERARKWLEGP
jgi:hypothetical protein